MVPLRGKKGPNSSLHCCHSETALAVEESAAACRPMVPATSRFLPSVEMTNAPEATTASENCCTAGCDLWPGQMPEQSRHCCHSETALAVEESAVACSAMVSATSRFLPSVGMTKCRDGTPRRRKTAAQPIVTSARANPKQSRHCCHSETALAVEESAVACSAMVPATSRFLPPVGMTNALEAKTASENCCATGRDLCQGKSQNHLDIVVTPKRR